MNTSILKHAKNIWDYMHMYHKLEKADIIVACGSTDLTTGTYASELFLKGYASYIIFSGDRGYKTPDEFMGSEADLMAKEALALGVPESAIIVENTSTNTGENIIFSQKILQDKNISFQKIILVHKPYMERRTYATARVHMPDKDIIVTSRDISFEEYMATIEDKDRILNFLTGDLQRIKEYPAKGFQIEQEIPDDVWCSYEFLVEKGYTEFLIQ